MDECCTPRPQISSSSSGKSGQHLNSMRRSTSLDASEFQRRKSKKISWADLESLEEVFREEGQLADQHGKHGTNDATKSHQDQTTTAPGRIL